MQQEQMIEKAKEKAKRFLMSEVGQGLYFYEDSDSEEKCIALSIPHPYEPYLDYRGLIARTIEEVENEPWKNWHQVVAGEEFLYLEISTCDTWEKKSYEEGLIDSEEEVDNNIWFMKMSYDQETKEWYIDDLDLN